MLSGVHDEATQQSLISRCTEQLRARRKRVLLLSCSLMGAAVAVVVTWMSLGFWGRMFAFFLGALTVTLFLKAWERRQVRRMLPDVLRAHGRCENCGYDLSAATAGQRCPECGAPFESPRRNP
jgi:Flp pilus assembly protein TadB